MGAEISVTNGSSLTPSPDGSNFPLTGTKDMKERLVKAKNDIQYDPVKKCTGYYDLFSKCSNKYGELGCAGPFMDYTQCSLVAGVDTAENHETK
jgi:hypothetical protein